MARGYRQFPHRVSGRFRERTLTRHRRQWGNTPTDRTQARALHDPDAATAVAAAVAERLAVGLDASLADPAAFKQLARLLLRITLYPGGRADIEVRIPGEL
jgi:hypothetical protein